MHRSVRSIVRQVVCKILAGMNLAKLNLSPKLYVLVSSGDPKLLGYGSPSYKLLIPAAYPKMNVHLFLKLIHVKLLQKASDKTS